VVKSFTGHRNFAISGITHLSDELLPKRIEIFKDAFPNISRIVFFYNPYKVNFKLQSKLVKKTAELLGLEYLGLTIVSRQSLMDYLKTLKLKKNDGILIFPDALGMANADLQIKISHKLKIPLMVLDNAFIEKGGCIGYSPSFYYVGLQAASIANMLFQGIKAENIPVQYPDKIELIVNLKEIEMLGLFDKFNKDYLIFAEKVIR
jgi:putative ABC transport system substrate-binding protein